MKSIFCLSIYLSICLSHGLMEHWATIWSDNQTPLFLSFICSLSQGHSVRNIFSPGCHHPIVLFFYVRLIFSFPVREPWRSDLARSEISCDMPMPLHLRHFTIERKFFVGYDGFPCHTSHLFIGDMTFIRDFWSLSSSSAYFCLFLPLMSTSHKNIRIWTWPRNATVWSKTWYQCSWRPYVLELSKCQYGQSNPKVYSVTMAPDIWNF